LWSHPNALHLYWSKSHFMSTGEGDMEIWVSNMGHQPTTIYKSISGWDGLVRSISLNRGHVNPKNRTWKTRYICIQKITNTKMKYRYKDSISYRMSPTSSVIVRWSLGSKPCRWAKVNQSFQEHTTKSLEEDAHLTQTCFAIQVLYNLRCQISHLARSQTVLLWAIFHLTKPTTTI